MTLIRSGRVWIGAVVSVTCLWLALRSVPFAEFGRLLGSADYIWLGPAAGLQLASIVARARRWTILLEQEDHLADAFWAQGVGYLFTNVLPLRLGEPARVAALARRCDLPVVRVGATALVERLLDVATILALLALVLPWMQVPSLVIQAGAVFGVLALAGLAALAAVARLGPRAEARLHSLFERTRLLPAGGILARWHELLDGLRPLTRWRLAARILWWSVVCWAPAIGMYWCVIRAFKVDAALVEAAFMLVALGLAVSVPSSPGFIGVFQLIGQQALVQPFGARYDATTALAITMAVHLTYYLLTTGLGVVGLWRLGGSFVQLAQMLTSRRSASIPKTAPTEVAQ